METKTIQIDRSWCKFVQVARHYRISVSAFSIKTRWMKN